jgi:hypothetical protein
MVCLGQDSYRTFHLTFTPGLDFGRLTIENSPEYRRTNIRLGGEVEFLLPVYKQKWGIFAEPAFQSFNEESVAFRYESVEVSLGVRHYFYLKNRFSFFINLISLMDAPIKHTQQYSLGAYGNIVLEDDSIAAGFAGGGGFRAKRVSVEGRFYTQRVREGTQLALSYYYGKASIIFGFRLF